MITEVHGDKFIIVRPPCLMEDEGNWHILAVCDTRTQVAEFCKKYTEESQGYFKLSDLCYIGSYFSGDSCRDDMKKWMPINIREYMVQSQSRKHLPRNLAKETTNGN